MMSDVDGKNRAMRIIISIVLIAFALLCYPGKANVALCAEDNRPMLIKILRDKPLDPQDGHYLLEIAPCYYKYKTDTADWQNVGLLFKAYIAPAWEVSIGSDFISYQNPDFGLSDLYVGAQWKFYEKKDWTLALSGYVLFPTGDKAFREPGIEPTVTLFLRRKIDNWDISLSVGSTYAADDQGEANYLDAEFGLEVDYTPDQNNSFGAFASGYGPDQRIGGSPRIAVGSSYTRTLAGGQSLGITLMKGLSDKGMDWSGICSYSYLF